MPRKRRPSDDLTNARKRATRTVARLEKAGNVRDAEQLRYLIAGTYQKAGAYVSLKELDTATVRMRSSMQSGTQSQPRQRSQPGTAQARPQARKPRPPRPGDEVYNARRRVKRLAERLLKKEQAEPEDTASKVAKGYAQYLLQQAMPTGRLTPEERARTLERLGRLREKAGKDIEGGFRVQRRNSILMQQLNAAGTEGADSAISERQKDVFWAATKGLWPSGSNVPRNERYDKILEHFYRDDTTDAKDFRAWLEKKKGTNAQDSFGDLQLVYEYVTEEMNDPALYDDPELPYETAMQYVITAM